MAGPCDELEPFIDGDLPPDAAQSFRDHLPECARCQRELTELLHLKLIGKRHIERVGTRSPSFSSAPGSLPRWGRTALLAAASLSVLLLLVMGVWSRSAPSPGQGDVWLADRPQRLLDGRLSYPAADRYRPPASKTMGRDRGAERLPLEELARLEKEDPHGAAAAYLVRNDKGFTTQALQHLQELPPSADRDSDSAAAKLVIGEFLEALRHTDAALAKQPRHPQAMWNRGLALEELKLPLTAARAFRQVAALAEEGWAQEATQRAESLQGDATQRHARWNEAVAAGKALLEPAPIPLPESFSQFYIARLLFYDAVRAAPNRERALALLPLAQELDARSEADVLEAYVRRVADADFSRRAPLAQDYAALVRNQLPAERRQPFLTELLASDEEDILLGALVLMDAVGPHLARFDAIASATGDRWFQLLAAQVRATVEERAGRKEQAAQLLIQARQLCPAPGLEYRCIFLRRELTGLYIQLYQFDAAREQATEGWQEARAGNEWALERDFLWDLAQVARFVNDASLARAYFTEFLAGTPDDLETVRRVHQHLADIALHQLQVEEARVEIDTALATGRPLSFSGALTLADISRMRPAPDDEAALHRALDEAMHGLGPGEKAIATHVRGRFVIERDAGQGRSLLWKAIEEAEALSPEEDLAARRARAYSFTSLILEAGRRSAFNEALELVARERAQVLPPQCLLVAAVDSERTLLVVRGAAGEQLSHYDATRREPLGPQLDRLVPETLLASLRACTRVQVIARPPLHGRPGLLPPDMAWSYLTRLSEHSPTTTLRPVRLVVTNVELPAGTPLRRLNTWTPALVPGEHRVTVSGAQATPSRVRAAMKNATEIDFFTHGVLNSYSDASYLLLASEQGRSELRVSRVRTTRLSGAPFVVLAACHAAHTAYALHEPLSLPAAFIEAGARGVLAATVEILDLEAGAFFDAVRERMRSGVDPAVALRDERMRWLAEGRGGSWIHSVLLFD